MRGWGTKGDGISLDQVAGERERDQINVCIMYAGSLDQERRNSGKRERKKKGKGRERVKRCQQREKKKKRAVGDDAATIRSSFHLAFHSEYWR